MKDAVILLASYNRREKTLTALESIAREARNGLDLHVILVDASSPDGTAAAVRDQFDQELVSVLDVPDTTYWAQAMRVAWLEARVVDAAAVVWLNDDVLLDDGALVKLQRWSAELDHSAALVGSVRDASAITYSGYRRGPWWNRLKLTLVPPNGQFQACDTFNGNVVWIPRGLDDLVGGFPDGFVHGMADLAYGFRLRQKSVSIYVAPEAVGVCARNSIRGTWQDPELDPRTRWKLVNSPKALPIGPWARLALRHGGVLGFLQLVKPYIDITLMGRRSPQRDG
jgi:GT2 family glycosyltransferase